MLFDKKEIEIISKARQKNVRDPKRSRYHFERIFDDFFQNVSFENGVYIDLGAGQYDFCEIIKNSKVADALELTISCNIRWAVIKDTKS